MTEIGRDMEKASGRNLLFCLRVYRHESEISVDRTSGTGDVDDKLATSIGSVADHDDVYADRSGHCLEG